MSTKDSLSLIKPTKKYSKAIMEFRKEFLDAGETQSMPGSNKLCDFNKFDDWFNYIKEYEKEETVPVKDHVPSFQYLFINNKNNKILGMLQIRTRLNDNLFNIGGHLGGCIRPSERNKGYSTEMIKLGLKEAKKFGLSKILITCKKDNISSAKSIVKAGGILENEVNFQDSTIQRYWLEGELK